MLNFLISFLILSYPFGTLFIKTNLKLTFESIKPLDIMSFRLFNLYVPNDTILSRFLFFLTIDLCFLILEAIAHIFNPIEKLVILIRIPNKEVKARIDIDPVIVEAKIRKCSM